MNMLRIAGTEATSRGVLRPLRRAGHARLAGLHVREHRLPGRRPSFVAEVAAEAAQQLALWQRHPCVAVVCGNCEVAQQAAMWGATPRLDAGAAVRRAAARDWSPSAGPTRRTCRRAPAAAPSRFSRRGRRPYYGVGAYLRPLDDARRGLRFATECLAFANVPDEAAVPARLRQDGAASSPRWKERVPRDLGAAGTSTTSATTTSPLFGVDPGQLRVATTSATWSSSRAVTGEVMARRWASGGAQDRCAAARWCCGSSECGRARAGACSTRAGRAPSTAYTPAPRAAPVAVSTTDEGVDGLALHVVNDRPIRRRGRLRWRCTASWENSCSLRLRSRPRSRSTLTGVSALHRHRRPSRALRRTRPGPTASVLRPRT